MGELLKVFNENNEFVRSSYFTLLYDTLSSSISVKVPLEESKENLNRVLNLMHLSNDYEIIFKKWNTENSSNADFKKDFPYQILYKSTKLKSTIWISLENDAVNIEFLYDCNDSALENWVIQMNHNLRKSFGLFKMPTYKAPIKKESHFQMKNRISEKVQMENSFNDEFLSAYIKLKK